MSLAALTTLRVGGPALSTVTATSAGEVAEAVRAADRAREPVLLVAGGSNLLVADTGFQGTAVLIRNAGYTVVGRHPDWVIVRIAAGQPWDEFVVAALAEGWSGIEALSGIPGSAGATPIQNVGAYGAQVGDVLVDIGIWDRHTGRLAREAAQDLGLAYRSSTLKCSPGRAAVLDVTLRLRVGPESAPIRYAELAARLGAEIGTTAPACEVREAVLELRRGKGMVLDPTDHDTWSAGSFFTNPILTAERAGALPEGAPRFAQPGGRVKTSAAWLISHAGFDRGYSLPGSRAAVSTKHTLALTNRGGATATEILDLARHIRQGVEECFGVRLENEPVFVGCSL